MYCERAGEGGGRRAARTCCSTTEICRLRNRCAVCYATRTASSAAAYVRQKAVRLGCAIMRARQYRTCVSALGNLSNAALAKR